MSFEWDPGKATTNQRKHGIDFADAATVFADELAVTRDDDDPAEARYITLGMDAQARVLVVIWTWRHDSIRIISARQATRSERRQYEERR